MILPAEQFTSKTKHQYYQFHPFQEYAGQNFLHPAAVFCGYRITGRRIREIDVDADSVLIMCKYIFSNRPNRTWIALARRHWNDKPLRRMIPVSNIEVQKRIWPEAMLLRKAVKRYCSPWETHTMNRHCNYT